MNLGERIKYIRGNHSQDDFGSVLGVHRNTVSAWECNKIIPKGEAIKEIFEKFNINLNWLFSGKGKPYLEGLNLPSDNTNLIMESANE